VARFNWPKYAAAAGLGAAAVYLVAGVGVAPLLAAGLVVGAGAGAVWTLTSVAATWWVYDHRRVYDLIAAPTPAQAGPGPWVAVHAGFDDATPRLAARQGPPAAVIALRSDAGASIDRAARRFPAPGLPARPGALPLADGRAAAAYLSFAAHEVHGGPARAALFAGLARALRPGGRLVVTEHVLDPANLAVYGPGALHFRTRRTWLAGGAAAGLVLVDETRLSPFVRRFTWQR
jgi:SAM-dependent methyltransferase